MASSLFPDQFYRAFEDRYRGSRELIKQRLQVYLPFMLPLAALRPDLAVLDLGCGRGEWLELLTDHAISASGVDTDDGMLAACRERGFDVLSVDALTHLNSLGNASVLAVTGFHIAEHLSFDVLQSLFAQAFRVLAPGGLLILETPNPENLLVGAANFYMDPTHQRPLPSQLLAFMAEHQGFGPVRVLGLQAEERLAQGGSASLYDVLARISPDYAVVAQLPFAGGRDAEGEPRPGSHLSMLQEAFDIEGGISLFDLANRYDHQAQLEANSQRYAVAKLQNTADQTSEQIHELASQTSEQFQQAASQTSEQIHELASQTSEQFQQAASQTSEQIHELASQTSEQFQQAASQTSEQIQQLNGDVQRLGSNVSDVIENIQQIKSLAEQADAQLAAVYASRSWRITQPLRWLGHLLHRISGKN